MQIIQPSAVVKAIYTGAATMSGTSTLTVTIPAVVVSKSEPDIKFKTYVPGTAATDLSGLMCSCRLISSTQLELSRASSAGICYVDWSVKENG